MDMYNDLLEFEGFRRLPPVRIPGTVRRKVKSDIPEVGDGLKTLDPVGMIMKARFKGCTGCRSCQRKCPEGALTVLGEKGNFEVNVRSDLCLGTSCQACEFNCPEKVYVFKDLQVSI